MLVIRVLGRRQEVAWDSLASQLNLIGGTPGQREALSQKTKVDVT